MASLLQQRADRRLKYSDKCGRPLALICDRLNRSAKYSACSQFTTFGKYALNLFARIEVSELTDLASEDPIVQFVQNFTPTNDIALSSLNNPAWATEAQILNNSDRMMAIVDVHPLHFVLMARPYSDIYLSALVIYKP